MMDLIRLDEESRLVTLSTFVCFPCLLPGSVTVLIKNLELRSFAFQ